MVKNAFVNFKEVKEYEDLLFLTFIKELRIQQASVDLQPVIEILLNWS